jgi:hypothetical protein
VSIWQPEALTPLTFEGEATTKDVPCTLSMQYTIRNGALEAGVCMRSSDAWLGLPYDLFNFCMLQRAVAGELKVRPGSLTLFIGSSHLYERNLEAAARIINVEEELYGKHGPDPLSRLEIPAVPDLEYVHVMMAEEVSRSEPMTPIVPRPGWFELLTLLAYRGHKNPALVSDPYRRLIDAS